MARFVLHLPVFLSFACWLLLGQGRGDNVSAMINKDLIHGLRIEMQSLGVYVPKQVVEPTEPAPADEALPSSSPQPSAADTTVEENAA